MIRLPSSPHFHRALCISASVPLEYRTERCSRARASAADLRSTETSLKYSAHSVVQKLHRRVSRDRRCLMISCLSVPLFTPLLAPTLQDMSTETTRQRSVPSQFRAAPLRRSDNSTRKTREREHAQTADHLLSSPIAQHAIPSSDQLLHLSLYISTSHSHSSLGCAVQRRADMHLSTS